MLTKTLYGTAIVFLLLIIVIIIYIPYIDPYGKMKGGSPPTIYLQLTRAKLKSMFDHQLPYKTVNGSWLSVSFNTMHHFKKDEIWTTLRNYYGITRAATLYPRTYMLPRDQDQVPHGKSYILKKVNTWARQGLKIVDDVRDVYRNSQEYDMVQVLIPNPHLINGFKYDLRMFLVIHYKYGILVFRESYFSYSNTQYDPKSDDMFARIGSLHLTPNFYQMHNLPKKASDYQGYGALYPKIVTMLKDVFRAFPQPLLSGKEIRDQRIKVFGIDVNVFKKNGTNVPMLIEMNSNPSLLFPEADWKNKLIYEMLLAVENGDLDQFSILRRI